MIEYDIQELEIQQVSKIKLQKLHFKRQIKDQINVSDKFKIYTNDQVSTIVSKIAIETKIQMNNISCVFMQGNKYLVPFTYSLNNLSFQNQSILDITLNFDNIRKQYTEIGLIPFKVNEILFLDKFKTEIDLLRPEITIRQQTLVELFDITKNIDIYILDFQEIFKEMQKNNQVFKQSAQINYFKYLFKYKYFPFSEESKFVVSNQFQLKQNLIQETLLSQSNQQLNDLKFKFIVSQIQLEQQLTDGQLDIQTLFDLIHIKEQPNIRYIQYLFIQDNQKFYAQKSYRDYIEPFKQFYEDVLIIQMESGAKCEILNNGHLSMYLDVSSSQFQIGNKDQSIDMIEKIKSFITKQLNILLDIINKKAPLSINQSLTNTKNNKQYSQEQSYNQYSQENQQDQQLVLQQTQYNMTCRVSVIGISVKSQILQAIIHENPEIFALREGTEAQILTNLFLNKQSIIRLVDSSRDEATFEIESICSRYVKLLIPALSIFILNNKINQDFQLSQSSRRGYQRLVNNDQLLFDGILENENYSRLCKKHQQPNPVSEEQKDDPNVTQYYNFTQQRNQYYECPSNSPYLGFITDKHIKDYCLPCCYPVKQNITKKKKLITETCLNEHKYSKSPQEETEANTYIFTNPNKLVISRNTVLHEHIQQLLYPEITQSAYYALFVYTLQIPEFTSLQHQKIASMIQSCCYVISITEQQFMKELKDFVVQYSQFEEQVQFLINLQEQFLDVSQYEFLISQFLDFQYQYNVIYIYDNTQISKGVSYGQSQLINFGMQRDYTIVLIKKKDIYNPVILGECNKDKLILRVDHIQKRYLKIPSKNLQDIKHRIEKEQQSRPHNVQKIVRKLQQSDLFQSVSIQNQIKNKQGYIYFIELIIKYKNKEYFMLLPTTPSIQLQEKITVSNQFTQVTEYNQNEFLLQLIIESIYKCTPQYRVLDGNTQYLYGFIFNSLFFYCNNYPNQQYKNIQIHPIINFNPILLNQSIIKQEFQKLESQTISASLKFNYFTNLYKLMKLQYAYQTNIISAEQFDINQMQSWDQIFIFKPMSQIEQLIQKLSIKQQKNIQELIKVKVCFLQDEKQFFCEGDKLIIPVEFQSYIQLLKNDIQRDLSIRYLQIYQIMLQQFIFQDKEGDHLQTGIANK